MKAPLLPLSLSTFGLRSGLSDEPHHPYAAEPPAVVSYHLFLESSIHIWARESLRMFTNIKVFVTINVLRILFFFYR